MAKTVIGFFDDYVQAQSAIQDLERSGVPRDDISLIANNAANRFTSDTSGTSAPTTTDETSHAAGTGAATGAVVGGGLGLAAGLAGPAVLGGLGLLAIPGVGPIAALGWLGALLSGAGIGAVAGGLIGALTHLGVPEEEAALYQEGIKRGGTLVAVKTSDEMADRLADILSSHGAIDIDERAEAYRQTMTAPAVGTAAPATATTMQQNFTPTSATAPAPRPASNMPPARPNVQTPPLPSNANRTMDANREAVLPVIEEELQVGKRQIQRGGVRVYSHMTEQPVEENVQLHEEHVNVERRPVNRPANEADMNAFKEETIEMRETTEEPVVSKQARVVEEVIVGKQATDRTETVRDTVRRTDVKVEQLGAEHVGRSRNFEAYDADFRNHYRATFGNRGGTYEQYVPAYEYGYNLRSNSRYQGRDWNTIEPEVRRDWEMQHPGNAWDQFKEAVRYSWDKATGSERGGIQTGGRDMDGTPDTRGVTEKMADAVTGDRIDDKTGKPVS